MTPAPIGSYSTAIGIRLYSKVLVAMALTWAQGCHQKKKVHPHFSARNVEKYGVTFSVSYGETRGKWRYQAD